MTDAPDGDRRRRTPDRAALRHLLRPERVAVVGASRDRDTIGGVLFDNLVSGGFSGETYPVNPKADEVQGVRAYPSLADCPERPDLVFVVVPAPAVVEVVDQAGGLGIDAVCVISAGFAEAGEEGRQRERALVETAGRHGVRVVGPNCMGVLNAAADVRMNGTFSRAFPPSGRIGLLSQSGALGLAVLGHVDDLGLGLASFVSVGNTADVSGTDLLEYWADDDETGVILLYLESFGEPRRFRRLAKEISRHKPIVAVKSGRTGAGRQAASSHTAAVAGRDVAVDALFAQTGVIRTDTLAEMFEVTSLLANGTELRGRRVGIVTNGGGPGILAADACEANGLDVPALGDTTQQRLLEALPPEAAARNPVDLLAGAGADTYRHAVEVVGTSGDVDVVLVIFIPPIVISPQDVAEALVEVRARLPDDVPVVGVFMGGRDDPASLADAGIASFPSPEEAARALGHLARWSDWRRRPQGSIVRPLDIDRARGRRTVDRALQRADADGGVWLTTDEAIAVLAAYGVPLARTITVQRAAEAGEAQSELGTSVAVKVDAPIHKADVGAVRLDLSGPEEAAGAVAAIDAALRDAGLEEHTGRYLVQEMAADGVQMAIGVNDDEVFGPLLMLGLGGELIELIGDVSVRVTPVTDVDVAEMIGSLRARELLTGYRTRPPADIEALQDLLHRVDALADDVPELQELDCNPVFVHQDGVTVTDVRIRLRVG